jgi:hypothetical protein
MTTRPPITSLGFCIRITVAFSPIIDLLLPRLVGWRLSSSSCQALDPEQVCGASDAERHARGDGDDVAEIREAFIPDVSQACSTISETRSASRILTA